MDSKSSDSSSSGEASAVSRTVSLTPRCLRTYSRSSKANLHSRSLEATTTSWRPPLFARSRMESSPFRFQLIPEPMSWMISCSGNRARIKAACLSRSSFCFGLDTLTYAIRVPVSWACLSSGSLYSLMPPGVLIDSIFPSSAHCRRVEVPTQKTFLYTAPLTYGIRF